MVLAAPADNVRGTVLSEAIKCVCSDRDIQYGSPEDSFAEIGKLWSIYLDHPVSASDVGILMTLFKIARIKTGHMKRDNYIDAAGYIACAAEIAEREESAEHGET